MLCSLGPDEAGREEEADMRGVCLGMMEGRKRGTHEWFQGFSLGRLVDGDLNDHRH